MESRVFSRATTIAHVRRPLRESHSNTSCSFISIKPIGAVGEGGNLIWGRQLRPSLLLEASSPINARKDILRPVMAAASSPAEGSDSSGDGKVAPIGFFDKYPALVTGFFFFMCFVSVIHLFVGVVYCLVSWTVGLPKRAPIDSNLLKLLIPVAVCHALGHVTSNVSFAAVAVSFTHTIKGDIKKALYYPNLWEDNSLEPFFNAAASQFVLGQSIPITLWLSLMPVVLGVSMASLTELSFNWTGFISAMISNISFTYRSLYSKKAMTDMDSTNIYAYISIIALFVCIPPAILVEGPQLIKHGFNDAIAKLATNTLERVAPLTHAVGNVLKRVFVIGFSILVFGNKISTQTGIGTGIAIAGVATYSYIKAKMEEEKRVTRESSMRRKEALDLGEGNLICKVKFYCFEDKSILLSL
ncbi:hypothetical protein POTOM_015131 [Populus tomentosa]|uniref:Sugar phosphate transporter domain-containing protein n=1 Tax=Populus tomentosa TaxID=118781 RepID=A0A8X7ZZD7_POPTO|nr:hypothetical protein POTOM_015131 [Populus tomentosa]